MKDDLYFIINHDIVPYIGRRAKWSMETFSILVYW